MKRHITFDEGTNLNGLAKEIEYVIAVKGCELRRDILYHEQEKRVTNPFSWSPGPTRVQFYT